MIRFPGPFPLLLVGCVFAVFVAGGLVTPAMAEDAPDTTFQQTFIPQYEVVDTTRVEGDAMTLREIIAKCVEGERTKLAGHENLSHTLIVRTLIEWKSKREIRDEVLVRYLEVSGFERTIHIDEKILKEKREDGEWVLDDRDDTEDGESSFEVSVNDSDGENELTRIPFFLEDQTEFDFELLSRTLEDETVIFKIAFRPKSDFKPLPSGTVYVDADRFRIIHEEFRFDSNPFPLLIGGIDRVSRQWVELPTGEWVASKIMAEVKLRGSWTGVIPKRLAVAVHFEDHVFDAGFDDQRFGAR